MLGWPARPPEPHTWVQAAWLFHWSQKNPHREQRLGRDVVTREGFRLVTTRNLILHRAVADQLGGFNEELTTGEDTDFAFRADQAGIPVLGCPRCGWPTTASPPRCGPVVQAAAVARQSEKLPPHPAAQRRQDRRQRPPLHRPLPQHPFCRTGGISSLTDPLFTGHCSLITLFLPFLGLDLRRLGFARC